MNHQQNEVIQLLASVQGLKFTGFDSEFTRCYPPADAWRAVASMDSSAFDTINGDLPEEDLSRWLTGIVSREIRADRLLLSVGGQGSLPWAEIELLESTRALVTLWLKADSREILFADEGAGIILGLTCEEYTYEARKLLLRKKDE